MSSLLHPRSLLCAMAIVGFCGFTVAAGAADHVNPRTVLNTLRPDHPRLILTNEELARLKEMHQTDTTLQGMVEQVLRQADAALEKPMLERRLVGHRLLSVSRECVARVYTLGLAWRWTGDEKYAQAVEANLLAVCAFDDWNPVHFLDTAEMSHAVGIGYDWCYGALSEESRERIRQGLIAHGMEPGARAYEKPAWWTKSEFNWNQVCNSGLLIGALAIADTDHRRARFIVARAVSSLPTAIEAYGPDGAWMEGPGYWHYATRYTAYGIAALDTALGMDFGLSEIEGLSVTGQFPNYTTGPTGLALNYADSGERSRRRPMPCMFWLARKFGDRSISDAEHAVAGENGARAEHVVWYVPPSAKTGPPRDLDRHFRSPVDIVVMRSAWDDPEALFVGVKGGYNQVNHGHLDLGNFELDALGVRWARDLGSDNYDLPWYWDKRKGGRRWKYYRLRSASHNVPMLGGREQDEEAVARVLDFHSAPGSASVTIDFTSAYPEFAARGTRDVALVNRRRAVVVRDQFRLTGPCEIVWGMTTDATIEVEARDVARLTLGGKDLIARILAPADAGFSVESAEQAPPEKTNKGVRRLVVRVDAARGEETLSVALAPVWPDGGAEAEFDMSALPH